MKEINCILSIHSSFKSEWGLIDTVLPEGMMISETDTGFYKITDGVNKLSDIKYGGADPDLISLVTNANLGGGIVVLTDVGKVDTNLISDEFKYCVKAVDTLEERDKLPKNEKHIYFVRNDTSVNSGAFYVWNVSDSSWVRISDFNTFQVELSSLLHKTRDTLDKVTDGTNYVRMSKQHKDKLIGLITEGDTQFVKGINDPDLHFFGFSGIFPTHHEIIGTTGGPAVVEDGDTVITKHNGLTIGPGVVFTPENRCKGWIIQNRGDLIIDGTISMTARGPLGDGDNLGIHIKRGEFVVNPTNFEEYEHRIGAEGGAGGASIALHGTGSKNGITGAVGKDNACGGGGSGGVNCHKSYCRSGAGSSGTSYAGGSGGGGVGANTRNLNATHAQGGVAGRGYGWKHANGQGCWCVGCGGAGVVPGASSYVGNRPGGYIIQAQKGVGGLLCIFVEGDLIINESGKIEANGRDGGRAIRGSNCCIQGAGGGSGGGSILIFYAGELVNNGTVEAKGGFSSNGGHGGAGTVKLIKVNQK